LAEEKKPIPTAPGDYRKGNEKIFKCTSGFVVKMRKMSVSAMGEMLSILGLSVPQGVPLEQAEKLLKEQMKSKDFTKNVIDAAEYVVPYIVIAPKIIQEDTYKENALSIAEIDPGDLFEIFNEGVEFSGLAGAAARIREKFRKEPIREGSEDTGAGVTPPTV